MIMKEKLLKIFKEKLPNKNFEQSDNLINDGVVDSLTMALIIGIINSEFVVSIPFYELNNENFKSIDSIVYLIEKCRR